MKINTYVTLTHDEVQDKIPYPVICEMRYGARWDTSRRRRLWMQEFTEAERKAASDLFKHAHSWYFVKGVPNEVKMKGTTLALWMKLGAFCGSL